MIKNHLKTLPRFIRGNFSTNKVIFEPKIENFFFSNFSNLRVFRDPPPQNFFDQKYKKKTLSWVFKSIFWIMILSSSLSSFSANLSTKFGRLLMTFMSLMDPKMRRKYSKNGQKKVCPKMTKNHPKTLHWALKAPN